MISRALDHSITEIVDGESILNNCVRYGRDGEAFYIRGLVVENEALRHEIGRLRDEVARLQCQIMNQPPAFSFDTTVSMPICD